MSYDISLNVTVDTGGPEPATFEVYDGNMTSNVARMWRHAGCDLAEFHEKPARELAPVLRQAVEAMEADPATYRAMNPPNGWGDYEGCLAFLKEILEKCDRHPIAVVEVWR